MRLDDLTMPVLLERLRAGIGSMTQDQIAALTEIARRTDFRGSYQATHRVSLASGRVRLKFDHADKAKTAAVKCKAKEQPL